MEASSHALALDRTAAIDFAARAVHQPDARPSRLPPRPRRLLLRQAAALLARRANARPVPWPSSTWVTSTAADWRTSARRTTATTCGRSPWTTAVRHAAPQRGSRQRGSRWRGSDGADVTARRPRAAAPTARASRWSGARLACASASSCKLAARFNVENALLAAAALLALGVPLATIAAAFARDRRCRRPLRGRARRPAVHRARRLLAHAGLARERAVRRHAASPPAACWWCSAAAAIAIAASGR